MGHRQGNGIFLIPTDILHHNIRHASPDAQICIITMKRVGIYSETKAPSFGTPAKEQSSLSRTPHYQPELY